MSLANGFLPMTMEEVQELGIEQLDFIYVTGDAYVDHASSVPTDITSGSYPSLTGRMMRASRCWARPGLVFWSPREIWIRW